MRISQFRPLLLSIITFAAMSMEAIAAINPSYWAIWDNSDESNQVSIDHDSLDQLLGTYVVVNHPSGINRFRYGDVSARDSKKLRQYVALLADSDPRDYCRNEQKAYWLNLYNALTIRAVLHNYPIKSLAKSRIKTKNLIKVAGIKLSLEDIENRFCGQYGRIERFSLV